MSVVIFDVGSTLIHPDFVVLADWLQDSTGFRRSAEEVERAFRVAVNGDLRRPVSSAQREEGRTFFSFLGLEQELEECRIDACWAEVNRGGGEGSWLYTVLDPDAVSVLSDLKQGGCTLVAASNSNGTLRAELRSFRLLDFFDEVYDSALLGTDKPARQFYMRVLANSTGRWTLHVGDDLINDCIAPAACGFHQVLLYDPLDLLPGLPRYLKIQRLPEILDAMEET